MMAADALLEVRPTEATIAPAGRVRRGAHPLVLGLVSGIVLWTAFPPIDFGPVAWVGLVPLFLLVTSRRSRRSIYLGAWAGGLAFWLLSLNWILCIDPAAALGWGLMASVLSLLWPAFLGLARFATDRVGLAPMLALPIVWTGIEYVRAYLFTGFPWYYLAHSQYRSLPLIQMADVTGSLGLSFLVATVNAFTVDALTLPWFRWTSQGPRLRRPTIARVVALGLGLLATLGYGAYRLATARFEAGPRVALLQSNFMQRSKTGLSGDEILKVYSSLIVKAITSPERPDLIVWPETSYPYGFVSIDPKLTTGEFTEQIKRLDPESKPEEWRSKESSVADQLHGWTDQVGIPMVVGSTLYDFRAGRFNKFNAAILFEPGVSTFRSYQKLHLVPFGEYVPLLQTFPWLTALTPYRDGTVPSLSFGGEPAWFDGPRYRYATAICFEDTVPQVTRRLFAEATGDRPPDVLLNLSNDGWFTYLDDRKTLHGSAEHQMHLASSVFRTVEHRVPLVRAANTGISAVIDGSGRVVANLAAATEDVLVATVPLDPRVALYTSWGDWFGQGCLAVTIGLVPLGLWRRRGREGR